MSALYVTCFEEKNATSLSSDIGFGTGVQAAERGAGCEYALTAVGTGLAQRTSRNPICGCLTPPLMLMLLLSRRGA